MPTPALDTLPLVPASVYGRLKRETNLAAMTQDLAGLRFSILLLARWEAAQTVDPGILTQLRHELSMLRALYLDKIDTLAMSFGVQQAMETQRSVERSVVVPKGMAPPLPAKQREQEQLYF